MPNASSHKNPTIPDHPQDPTVTRSDTDESLTPGTKVKLSKNLTSLFDGNSATRRAGLAGAGVPSAITANIARIAQENLPGSWTGLHRRTAADKTSPPVSDSPSGREKLNVRAKSTHPMPPAGVCASMQGARLGASGARATEVEDMFHNIRRR